MESGRVATLHIMCKRPLRAPRVFGRDIPGCTLHASLLAHIDRANLGEVCSCGPTFSHDDRPASSISNLVHHFRKMPAWPVVAGALGASALLLNVVKRKRSKDLYKVPAGGKSLPIVGRVSLLPVRSRPVWRAGTHDAWWQCHWSTHHPPI